MLAWIRRQFARIASSGIAQMLTAIAVVVLVIYGLFLLDFRILMALAGVAILVVLFVYSKFWATAALIAILLVIGGVVGYYNLWTDDQSRRFVRGSTGPMQAEKKKPERYDTDDRAERKFDDSHIPTYYEPRWPEVLHDTDIDGRHERHDRYEHHARRPFRIREREIGVRVVRPGYPSHWPAKVCSQRRHAC